MRCQFDHFPCYPLGEQRNETRGAFALRGLVLPSFFDFERLGQRSVSTAGVRPLLTVGLRSVSGGKAPVNGPSVADGGQWPLPRQANSHIRPSAAVQTIWDSKAGSQSTAVIRNGFYDKNIAGDCPAGGNRMKLGNHVIFLGPARTSAHCR